MDADYSLPRSVRLRHQLDFNRVFKSHTWCLQQGPFTLMGCQSSIGVCRIGLVIPKKQVARAVDRVRLKRLCRECFRHRRHELPLFDIVLLCKKPSLVASQQELLSTLDSLFDVLVDRSLPTDSC